METKGKRNEAIQALAMLGMWSDCSDYLVKQISQQKNSKTGIMFLDVTDLFNYGFKFMNNNQITDREYIVETVHIVLSSILELNGFTGLQFEPKVHNSRLYYITRPCVY